MSNKIIDQVYDVVKAGFDLGISHQNFGDMSFSGEKMSMESGQEIINFSLCDYLGLSTDERLKEGAIQSIRKNGVYTAVSRTYLKLYDYKEAEEAVSKIFQHPTIIVPRTTLAHISTLPIIIDKEDAMILDHQVHTSVRLGSEIVRAQGVHTELLRHNNMSKLEERIKSLSEKYHRVWYLADGVYSMYGDTLPIHEIKTLMDKYPQFYCYVDDAHGMSWKGKNGKGFLLENMEYHPQLFMTTSLGKGFGAGGGAIVCPNEKVRERIAFTGAPIMFTSPTEPAILGSIKASAAIHMTNEIQERQQKLEGLVQHFHQLAKKYQLPVLSGGKSPIIFIAAGHMDNTGELVTRMLHRGFHLTSGVFPAVPVFNSGVRGIINLHQSKEDISAMVEAFNEEYYNMLNRKGLTVEGILKKYRI